MTMESAGGTADAGRGVDVWFTPGRFAAVLGLLIFACFLPVVTGQATFFYRDYALFTYPLAFHHKESFWNGEMPLWNPLSNCGLPFTAQWNTLTLYPLSLIYLLLPLPWSLGMFCLAHMFLAGMGMYFLAHRWTGSRWAASVAGAAFAFNGLTWHSLMWTNNIAALGWMPWVVLTMECAWREGGRRVIVAALAGAMQMLAGAPEIIMQTWMLLGVLWLVQLLQKDVAPIKLTARAMCAGALVAALAAAQLLPFLDLLAHSQRDSSFSDAQWAMPGSGWANYLVPLFHSIPASHGSFSQRDQYWTSSYYPGVVTVALALLAIWQVRNRRVWILAGLALFSIALAQGEHGLVYPVLRIIVPQIGFMRFPIKFVVLATFIIPLLAAYAVARFQSLPINAWKKQWKLPVGLVIVLASLIGILLLIARNHPQVGEDLKMTIWNGQTRICFLVLATGCFALLQRWQEPKKQMLFQTGLIVILWMDVFTHVPTLSPTVSPSVFQAGLMRSYNKWDAQLRPGQSRVMQTRESLVKMYWGSVQKPEDDVQGRRLTLYDDVNMLDDIPKVDGFYSLYLREMNAVLTELYTATNDLPHLKDFLGISHVNPPANPMEWVSRNSFMPLITGGQAPVFADDATALKLLTDPAFDERLQVILPLEAKDILQAPAKEEVKIETFEFAAHRIGAQVETQGPAMLVVAQAYYHPWRAYVDGHAVPLWRANYAFQALQMPGGRHKIELVYRDRRFLAGLAISLTALLVCSGAWLMCRRNRE